MVTNTDSQASGATGKPTDRLRRRPGVTCNGAAHAGGGAWVGQRRRGTGARREAGRERVGRGGREGLGRDAAEVGVEQLGVFTAVQRRLPLLQPAQVLRLHHDPVLPARGHCPRRPHWSGHPAPDTHHTFTSVFLLILEVTCIRNPSYITSVLPDRIPRDQRFVTHGPLMAAVVHQTTPYRTRQFCRDLNESSWMDADTVYGCGVTAIFLPCGCLVVAKEAPGGLTASTVHVNIHGHLSATFCNGLQLLLAYLQGHTPVRSMSVKHLDFAGSPNTSCSVQ